MGTHQLGMVGRDRTCSPLPPKVCGRLVLNPPPPRHGRISSSTSPNFIFPSYCSPTKVHHPTSSPVLNLSQSSHPKLQFPSSSPTLQLHPSNFPSTQHKCSSTSPSLELEEPPLSSSPKLHWSSSSSDQASPPPKPHQPSDFSIDHILRCAGPPHHRTSSPPSQPLFDWLQCTRYHPPKLQRSKKKDSVTVGSGPRRKLGRNPRIPFSAAQVAVLEERFRSSAYLSASDVSHLATLLRLSDTRIKIWFQNRRARERRDNGKVDISHIPPPRRHPQEVAVKSAFTPTEARH